MACIITTSINLDNIPKDKIFQGKKGRYLPISISVNNELDQFNNAGPVSVGQTKEEREGKVGKVYLGNVKVAWSDGVALVKTPYIPPQELKPVTPVADKAENVPF